MLLVISCGVHPTKTLSLTARHSIQSIHQLKEAMREREAMEKLDFQGRGALWEDEDERFDLGLTKFGVDIFALQEVPSAPWWVFRCLLEDWEKEAIKSQGQ